MIERKFVAEKMREFLVNDYLSKKLGAGKYSSFDIKRTPLGERIVIYTSRPGVIVGKGGENIKELTKVFKTRFNMENPQIEVAEITNPDLDAQTMAENVVNTLERFGPKRFKSVGYKVLQRIIDAGAMGAEIIISGRGLPGARAKSWRFYAGYLKKSGDVAVSGVKYAHCVANLNSGTVGVKVKILPPGTILPDRITVIEKPVITVQEVTVEEKEETKKKPAKKSSKKKKKEAETPEEKKEVEEENEKQHE